MSFLNCKKLNRICMPDSVTIFDTDFSGCENLEYVYISKEVTSVCSTLFSGLSNITLFLDSDTSITDVDHNTTITDFKGGKYITIIG